MRFQIPRNDPADFKFQDFSLSDLELPNYLSFQCGGPKITQPKTRRATVSLLSHATRKFGVITLAKLLPSRTDGSRASEEGGEEGDDDRDHTHTRARVSSL